MYSLTRCCHCARVVFTGTVGGDRAVVASRAFPQIGHGYQRALPFLWAFPAALTNGAGTPIVGERVRIVEAVRMGSVRLGGSHTYVLRNGPNSVVCAVSVPRHA